MMHIFHLGMTIMSSISVGELKAILDSCPEDYEVIMEISQKHTVKIAYINGIEKNDTVREVRLMN
jgi:hypothetical protein